MTYRHVHHAANFADIHKHVCLLSAWQNGVKQLGHNGLVDAFSGAADYPLNALNEVAARHVAVLKQAQFQSAAFQQFSRILNQSPDHYPGSSMQILQMPQKGISYRFNDINPDTYKQLYKHWENDKVVEVSQSDGYQLLEANSDQTFYFIDPPYVHVDESQRLLSLCRQIHCQSWVRQVLIWYPMFVDDDGSQMIEAIVETMQQPLLLSRLYLPWREKMCGSLLLLSHSTEQQQQNWQSLEADLKAVISANRDMDYQVELIDPY